MIPVKEHALRTIRHVTNQLANITTRVQRVNHRDCSLVLPLELEDDSELTRLRGKQMVFILLHSETAASSIQIEAL